ncbi:MAG: hypothetical protein LC649_05650 [Bacteroidales bacterium]|nr:hypothetical protein [Bacteroidales bacterium]
MVRITGILILVFLVMASCGLNTVTIEERLATLEAVKIDSLEPDSIFSRAWEIHLVQPVDHNNPDGERFSQKIYLSYAGADRPVVMVTEGYSAGRNYTTELARYLECNQIIVEHRYFGESGPDSLNWNYLTTWQAASDHHSIIETFSEVFRGDWITTGVSKGGQTVMFHSYYYPDDATVRVPYVAPLNFGPEDPRIYSFLDSVGTDYCRTRILEAQREILENRDIYYPMMLEMAEEEGYTFERAGGPEKVFELAVLEYDFAYWQWGKTSCDEIITEGEPEEIFNQFFGITDISYFSDSGISYFEPFFYQALTEIGYYGYRFDIFNDLLLYVSDGELPDFAFSAPDGVSLDYDYSVAENVDNYIRNASNFIFIYGMKDTWSATSVTLSGQSNSLKIMKKEGDHSTRIDNLDENDRELVLGTLNDWLGR